MRTAFPLLLLIGCTPDAEPVVDLCALPRATPPVCGTNNAIAEHLIAGPNEASWDAAMAAKADRFDRSAVLLNSWDTRASAPLTLLDPADRGAVETWLDGDGDLDSLDVDLQEDVHWWKAPGAFTGMAIAADAYRYGALRDAGADCELIDQARDRLRRNLDVLHMALEVTGQDGMIARAVANHDLPGHDTTELVPLFDGIGTALPYEKNNGTWRDDESHLYGDIIWEDSASRDQYIGWVTGMAASWEVMAGDATLEDLLARLRQDASQMLGVLRTVQDEGYDLEIRDPDGRRTYHGILHEESLDRVYVPGGNNPLNPVMALGIVTALTTIAETPDLDAWLQDELIAQRQLPERVRDHVAVLDTGHDVNNSNLSMAWNGAWLVQRYTCDSAVRATVTRGMDDLYQPTGQALYDLVRASQHGDVTALGSDWELEDNAHLAPVSESLFFYRESLWNDPVENCDSDEIETGVCVLDDGTEVNVLGDEGHGGQLMVDTPVPMGVRPWSTYHWRSNPYAPNGEGDGLTLGDAADFRFVYWAGRYARR